MDLRRIAVFSLLVAVVIHISTPAGAIPKMKLGAFGVRMEPEGSDSKRYSKASWGGGLKFVVVPENTGNLFALVTGFDVVRMLGQTTEFQDAVTLLRVEQQTNQYFSRLYVGTRIGPQGNGFFHPYAGANLALAYYSISTDVVIPDDSNRENEIRQNLKKEGNSAFGYDFALGMELNVHRSVYIDLGVKYLKFFSVPQQLGEGSEEVHPAYFQIFFGLGISLDTLTNNRR